MNSHTRPGQLQSLGQSLVAARLRKHADYLRAYAAGRKRQSASMSWFLAPQTLVRQDVAVKPEPCSGPCPGRGGLTVGKSW